MKKRSKKKPVITEPKKIVSAQEVIESKKGWEEKWNQYRTPLTLLGILGTIVLVVNFAYLSSLADKAKKGWFSLGNAWATITGNETYFSEMKIKEMGQEYVKLVANTLGDIDALPNHLKKDIKDLESLSVSDLPGNLKEKVLLKYHLSTLEDQLQAAPHTTASSWISQCLEQLHFLSGNPQKSFEYHRLMASKYPANPLYASLAQYTDLQNIDNDLKWRKENSVPESAKFLEAGSGRKGVLVTSKGKISIEIFEKECPINAANFIDLAKSGAYNGLNFYKITNDSVYTGCPLGNGKGNPGYTRRGEMKDLVIQRGFIAMDDYEEEGKIGSRFFIFKKYPWYGMRENYAFVGKVTDGLNVLEQLTATDVLLDASFE